MVRAQKKENKTNQAREWDRATRENRTTKQRSRTTKQRESDRATRETNNETKRAEQESEGVEHPLTFGCYVNIQIGK